MNKPVGKPTVRLAQKRMREAAAAVDRAETKLAHAEDRLRLRVQDAHRAGMTWDEIGTFFLMSRQAAHVKFAGDDAA